MESEMFDKLDRDLMKGLQTLREKPVPQEIRRNFRRSVEERILEIGRPPLFSWQTALIPAAVLVLGLALIVLFVKPRPVTVSPQMKEAPAVIRETAKSEVKILAPALPMPSEVKREVQVDREIQNQNPQTQAAVVSESDLLSEIETLKELGVWTDEDEEEIGISSDQIFEELEILMGESAQTGVSPDGSGAPAGQVGQF